MKSPQEVLVVQPKSRVKPLFIYNTLYRAEMMYSRIIVNRRRKKNSCSSRLLSSRRRWRWRRREREIDRERDFR
jgi:hypothetical protein